MPMPMFTFLEKYNLKGKTIHPFVTHEGSGLSGVQRLKKVTGAKVTAGLAIYGHVAQNEREKAQKEVDKWVKLVTPKEDLVAEAPNGRMVLLQLTLQM